MASEFNYLAGRVLLWAGLTLIAWAGIALAILIMRRWDRAEISRVSWFKATDVPKSWAERKGRRIRR